VPLSTRAEAEKLVEMYTAYAAGTNKQLRLSNPEVKALVFVPFTRSGNSVTTSNLSLIPEHISGLDLSNLVVL